VSIEAMMWAMNLAPVPMDLSAKKASPSSSCAFVLIALANHADPEGRDAFPGVATLVRYTRLSERTVRTCLDRLEADGVIRAGDPEVVAAKIKRGDRRPQGWDLAVERIREDLDEDDLLAIAKSNPLLRPFLAEARPDLGVYTRGATAAPRADSVKRSTERGATTAPRPDERGATSANGVQPAQSRGAVVAPEPFLNPTSEPTTTPTAADAPAAAEEQQLPLDTRKLSVVQGASTTTKRRAAAEKSEDDKARLAAAGEIADVWIKFAVARFGPYVGSAKNPFLPLRTRIVKALESGLTEDQVKTALREVKMHVPTDAAWQRAISKVTGHEVQDYGRPQRGARNHFAVEANTTRHATETAAAFGA
jgi:hypothetical protein